MPPHLRNNHLRYHHHYHHDLEPQQQTSSTSSHYDKPTTLDATAGSRQSPVSMISQTNLGGQRRKLMTYILLMIIGSCFIATFNLLKSFVKQSMRNEDFVNQLEDRSLLPPLSAPPMHPVTEEDLTFGVELSYLAPMEVLEKLVGHNDTTNTTAFVKARTESAKQLVASLREHSIPAFLKGRNYKVLPNAWKLQPERAGVEFASYLNPPRDEIQSLMKVANELHYQVDPDITSIHINVDAVDRSREEIRNVYKNYIAVEDAIDSIRTTTKVSVSGSSGPIGQQYKSVKHGYRAMDDWRKFPYPSYDTRTYPNGTVMVHPKKVNRKGLTLRKMDSSNTTKSFEFRGIQSSLDFNEIWAWIEFARNFIEASYSGIVLEPKERTIQEQWDALFGTLIRDDELESILKARKQNMNIPNSDRVKLVELFCHAMPRNDCISAVRGVKVRMRHEKRAAAMAAIAKSNPQVQIKTRKKKTLHNGENTISLGRQMEKKVKETQIGKNGIAVASEYLVFLE